MPLEGIVGIGLGSCTHFTNGAHLRMRFGHSGGWVWPRLEAAQVERLKCSLEASSVSSPKGKENGKAGEKRDYQATHDYKQKFAFAALKSSTRRVHGATEGVC